MQQPPKGWVLGRPPGGRPNTPFLNFHLRYFLSEGVKTIVRGSHLGLKLLGKKFPALQNMYRAC